MAASETTLSPGWSVDCSVIFLSERISAPDRWRERASGTGLGLNVGILAF